MIDVAADQLAECDRWVVADAAARPDLLLRNMQNHPEKMVVEGNPELYQVFPVCNAVALDFDPGLLLVVRPLQLRLYQRTHESLMIVRCGINQMSENLFRTPSLRPDRNGGIDLIDSLQIRDALRQHLAQTRNRSLERRRFG